MTWARSDRSCRYSGLIGILYIYESVLIMKRRPRFPQPNWLSPEQGINCKKIRNIREHEADSRLQIWQP